MSKKKDSPKTKKHMTPKKKETKLKPRKISHDVSNSMEIKDYIHKRKFGSSMKKSTLNSTFLKPTSFKPSLATHRKKASYSETKFYEDQKSDKSKDSSRMKKSIKLKKEMSIKAKPKDMKMRRATMKTKKRKSVGLHQRNTS